MNDRLRAEIENIYQHELVHLLSRHAWGTHLPLFWEGLAVALSDFNFHERFSNVNYHDYSRALLDHSKLLSMKRLLSPDTFYSARSDFRVDVQCGSFTSFLIESYGIQNLERLFRIFKRPSHLKPMVFLGRDLRLIFKKSYSALLSDWKTYLRTTRASVPNLSKMVLTNHKNNHLPKSSFYCLFCYSKLPKNSHLCLSCGIDHKIKLQIDLTSKL
jgi:hypothetical protein